ncbi:MAG: 50S ribosomal protein L25/general stress protein Ctc [Flavobacteriales bacterium]|jgi:large subunit ribosomal protein L25|nr:50S ribosomal protein L25/general stress protein Ctc [Flavobacteriales bacterium]
METIKLSAEARMDLGKKESKTLRKEGKVPCVLYGGEEVVHFSIPEIQFKNLVYTPNVYRLEIDVNGKTYSAILKDLQFHPVTDNILHADFIELTEGKEVTYQIPVRITGNAKGVMLGGKLRLNMRKLNVRSTPENMVSDVVLDVTPLGIGKTIRVSEIETNNFDILNAGNAVIVAVKTARGAQKEEEEEEGEE